ncbi:MAG: hypothetical protein Q8R37_01680 [Nanoarchaeota archaeon]|nr:hypothetical protein [Nanoarchaeota archaeon]
MQKLNILNTREIKKIKEKVSEEFGYFPEEKYAYLQNDKGKLFLITRDIAKIELQNLKIDRVGLYFAEVKENEIRLSKEGAQLLAEEARKKNKKLKNVVDLTKEEVRFYFTGKDLEKDLGDKNRFVLLEYNHDIFGCAKYKDHTILNFLPKIHRGEVII